MTASPGKYYSRHPACWIKNKAWTQRHWALDLYGAVHVLFCFFVFSIQYHIKSLISKMTSSEHCKATEKNSNTEDLEKRFGEISVDDGLQAQLEKDDGCSIRKNWMEISGPCSTGSTKA